MGDFLSLLTVREAVWIAPAVTAAHFLEEAPRFAKWARRHISARYTDERWRKIHGAGMLFAIGVTGLVSLWPRDWTVFLFISLYLAPMLFNVLFHVGASILYRSYSPGVITASLLHSTLFWYLISLFSGAALLRAEFAAAATIVGALVHGLDLASTTFFVNILRTSARALVVLSLLGLYARADAQQNTSQQPEPASPLPMMVIRMKPGDTHLAPMTPGEGNLTRWLDLDAASISLRYRHVENFLGATSANNLQHQLAVRGTFHFDPGRRFSIYAGLFTGSSFAGGWDNTGPGARAAQSNLYLKRLYFEARPIKGIEAQYGGLDFARGESSEITSYDYDGYLVGERLSIKRPQDIFFDEVAVRGSEKTPKRSSYAPVGYAAAAETGISELSSCSSCSIGPALPVESGSPTSQAL